jgi:hypothetical protein
MIDGKVRFFPAILAGIAIALEGFTPRLVPSGTVLYVSTTVPVRVILA